MWFPTSPIARWVGEVLATRPTGANKTQIIELGCGSGALSYALAELPRVQVHGVDIWRASIERAAADYGSRSWISITSSIS